MYWEGSLSELNAIQDASETLSDVLDRLKAMDDTPANQRDASASQRLEHLQGIVKIIKAHGVIDNVSMVRSVMERFVFRHKRRLLSLRISTSFADVVQEVRAATFRVVRFLIIDATTAELVWDYHLDLYLTRFAYD